VSQAGYPADDRQHEPYGWLEPVEEPRDPLAAWRPPARPRSVWRRYGINVLLFLLTVLSVYDVGGWRLVAGLMSILFAHEMGHYVACLLYRVDATPPYFIPLPIPGFTLVGTLGAFIRIRSPIPNRRALFDIGIAGPLAGFVVALPVLALGVLEARAVPERHDLGAISLGEPLLFKAAVLALRGPTPDGMTLMIGSLGLAAWFGLFVTALNLLPIGQLDGGHVTYAVFGPRSATISRAASWVCVLLTYFGPNWLVWSLLLRLLGRRHPPTRDDSEPVGRGRRLVAAVGLLVFAVCFVPDPFQWSWTEFFAALTSN
jgi:membrane-associated protease RseP (regulator of RpoE activity)